MQLHPAKAEHGEKMNSILSSSTLKLATPVFACVNKQPITSTNQAFPSEITAPGGNQIYSGLGRMTLITYDRRGIILHQSIGTQRKDFAPPRETMIGHMDGDQGVSAIRQNGRTDVPPSAKRP